MGNYTILQKVSYFAVKVDYDTYYTVTTAITPLLNTLCYHHHEQLNTLTIIVRLTIAEVVIFLMTIALTIAEIKVNDQFKK